MNREGTVDLSRLNSQQKLAATYTGGPLLILAGAGSGKTSTMTHRIAWLILDKGIDPMNIFAVTFTNKAANEMRERVESLVGSTEGMWIMTFHAACLRMLRIHAERIGYKPGFSIYDPDDQKAVIKAAIKAQGKDDKQFSPPYVLSIISDCKNKNISPGQFADSLEQYEKRLLGVSELYLAYQKTLLENNAMDFDDLLGNAVLLLKKNEDILERYRKRFKYIMVDEYQDTNNVQYEFIKLLVNDDRNICVVGDDDQCIYQWRGADISNILNFERDFKGTKVIKLEQNYRSTGHILAAAHSLIKKNFERKNKKLWTDKEDGEKIRYYRLDDDREEARLVAREISRLIKKDRKLEDFAVLYRTNAQSRRFEEIFITHGIPCKVLGGFRYYDRKEVKDMISYMRLVENPEDLLSLERIINQPKRGVGEKTLEKLKAAANERGESLYKTLSDKSVTASLSEKTGKALDSLIEMLTFLNNGKDEMRVSDIYEEILEKSGYFKDLESQGTVEATARLENIFEFKSVIYEYERDALQADEKPKIFEFLEKITLMSEIDNHNPDDEAVVLMTMHSAKGLEFPVVFMVGMEDGLFPGWRSMEKDGGLEEERRLCYVGITRAKEILYMTNAELRTIYGKTDYTRESSFLKEIDQKRVIGDALPYGKGFDRYSFVDESNATGNEYDEISDDFSPFSHEQKSFSETSKRTVEEVLREPENSKDERDFFEPEKPKIERIPLGQLQKGSVVNHSKFGEGKVLEVSGRVAKIDFGELGEKKMDLSIAPLKKVD